MRAFATDLTLGSTRQSNTCIEEKGKKRIIYQAVYHVCVADIMLRQDTGKIKLGKYLSDKQILRRRRTCSGLAVAGITTTASHTKMGKM